MTVHAGRGSRRSFLDGRIAEVVVRFRLLPLLLRRIIEAHR
jgi:hypothetical protein